MKPTLRKALLLFPFRDQLFLITAIIKSKFVNNLTQFQSRLLGEIADYISLIESGVDLSKIGPNEVLAKVELNNRSLKLIIRRHTSDLNVFKFVILEGEYKQALQYISYESKNQNYIVDAGANIGATTLYFLFFSPNSKIIALEPDKENYEFLLKNIELNGFASQVMALNAALWTKSVPLKIVNTFRDGLSWSLTVDEVGFNEQGSLYGYTLKNLLDINNISYLSLLKIDIEGGERFLFEDQCFVTTIDQRVKSLIIEIHDEYNIRDHINRVMKDFGFQYIDQDLVTIYVKN
jgi:FkbM family methyltransferase